MDQFAQLASRYPWPPTRPWPDVDVWDLGSRGRDLIVDLIVSANIRTVLEVGAFMGSSAKRWLDASPNVRAICIDPWGGDREEWSGYARKHGRHALAAHFDEDDGPYRAFMSAMWDYRDRLVALKGLSPEKLYEIYEAGVQPDLLYFDANKTGDGIEIAMQLFPRAVVAGDDWTWRPDLGYPARQTARRVARISSKRIRVKGDTWMLASSLSAVDLVNRAMESVRDVARAVRSRVI